MKRRFFAFSVCMAVLLASFTGCYSAQKDGPSMPSSSQTVQSGSGSGAEEPVEIKTYPLPEENVQADRIYAPSPSTGGFWTFAVFNASSIQAYDPVTRTSYIPCYQAGCKHNDESCTAYFGKEITALAEYRGNFYAMICYNDDTASALVTRPVSGGPLEVLARWEPENENEVRRCGLYGLSFGKAYLTVARETFAMEDGQMETADEEYSKCSLDLETGELVEYMADEDGYLPYMHGVCRRFSGLVCGPAGWNAGEAGRIGGLQLPPVFQKPQNGRRENDRGCDGKFHMDGGPTCQLGAVYRVSGRPERVYL